MVKDANGVPIELGDVVAGQGYNLACVIVGPVVAIHDGPTPRVFVAFARQTRLMGAGVSHLEVAVEHGSPDGFAVMLRGGWLGDPPSKLEGACSDVG